MSRKGVAGTDGKGDVLVEVVLQGGKREISIESSVEKKFSQSILSDVNAVLDIYDIQGATVDVRDRGAWGFAIRGRMHTAVKRALKGATDEK